MGLHTAGIRFNATESMPLGIYHLSPKTDNLKPGDWVSLCLPDHIYEHYKHRIPKGSCSNGSMPLFKEIQSIDEDGVFVVGHHPDSLDSRGYGKMPLVSTRSKIILIFD